MDFEAILKEERARADEKKAALHKPQYRWRLPGEWLDEMEREMFEALEVRRKAAASGQDMSMALFLSGFSETKFEPQFVSTRERRILPGLPGHFPATESVVVGLRGAPGFSVYVVAEVQYMPCPPRINASFRKEKNIIVEMKGQAFVFFSTTDKGSLDADVASCIRRVWDKCLDERIHKQVGEDLAAALGWLAVEDSPEENFSPLREEILGNAENRASTAKRKSLRSGAGETLANFRPFVEEAAAILSERFGPVVVHPPVESDRRSFWRIDVQGVHYFIYDWNVSKDDKLMFGIVGYAPPAHNGDWRRIPAVRQDFQGTESILRAVAAGRAWMEDNPIPAVDK